MRDLWGWSIMQLGGGGCAGGGGLGWLAFCLDAGVIVEQATVDVQSTRETVGTQVGGGGNG